MSTILIVLILLILVVVAASLAIGRGTYEVESARDTEFLELDGSWVRYDVIGGGPPVVLVHGWLGSSRVWEALARRLAQRFTVYSLDLTGFGESDKPLSGYGVRNGSRLLYAFCAHFGLTRASVIGHDLGGNMAVKLAADHPDVVGRVVLVSVPADEDQIDLPTPLWLATLPVVGPLFYALGRAFGPVRRMWVRPFVADPDDLTDEILEDAGKSTPAAVARTLSISRREISGGRLVRQAKIIKMPMLVVSGEEDQIVDPHSVSAWAGSVQRAEICLMDACGHVPMIERPAEFAAQILAFLTGDARYLDQSAPPPAASDDEEAFNEDDRAPAFSDDGDDLGSRHPYADAYADSGAEENPNADDTADLTVEYPIEEVHPEPNSPPRIHRKRGGGYPAEARDGQEPDPEPPESTFRGRERHATSADDPIPELPADLFDWPEPRRGPRRPPESPEADDPTGNPNGPSRA
jgi:pimeloyl-ACP methyl ester carboxylesterase